MYMHVYMCMSIVCVSMYVFVCVHVVTLHAYHVHVLHSPNFCGTEKLQNRIFALIL